MGSEYSQILVFEKRGPRTNASQIQRYDYIAIFLKLTKIESVLFATKENQQIQDMYREYESNLKAYTFKKIIKKTCITNLSKCWL